MRTRRVSRKGRLGLSNVLATLLIGTSAPLLIESSAQADILVVAPHPDDDVLTSAGVTYRALHATPPVPVWILYMTNGDDPGVSLGYQRQSEAAAAEALLGVDNAHLVFLGYQDGSLSTIHEPSYAAVGSSFTSDNPGVGNHTNGSATFRPYGAISGTNGLNNGFNVRADLSHFLNARRPTDIFVTGACDRHPDHAATYFFVLEALQALRSTVPSYDPIVHQTVVWAGFNTEDDWPLAPNPATYYTEPVRIATCLSERSMSWAQRESLDVPLPLQVPSFATNLKSRAIDLHDSQGGFTALSVRNPGSDGHISAFVHKDEFFFSARASESNRPPVPNAGSDQSVSVGSMVTLNGSGSFDPEGDPLHYQWRQSAGPAVTLSSSSVQRPTFTVPAGATNTVFAFELKVSNTTSFTSVADAVSISTGGVLQPVDGGVVPVDSGPPPQPDAGNKPVDAGTPVDAGSKPDSGSTVVDAGAQLDAGAANDAGGGLDADVTTDAGMADAGMPDADIVDSGVSLADGGESADAAPADPSDPTDPGDEEPIDEVDAHVRDGAYAVAGDGGDAGEEGRKKDSGCSVAPGQASDHFSDAAFVLGLAAMAARRRRRSRSVER